MIVWETLEISGFGKPHLVRMSFELPYLDWCRFEKSEVFQNLTAYLEELERQDLRESSRRVQGE